MENSILKPGNPIMRKDIKRFAFIGCGKIAHYHADVITALGHKIVAVAARPNSENIRFFSEKYEIKRSFYNYRIMLEEMHPDAIINCTSWDKTESLIEDVISYGVPVLVEKPIALSSHRIRRIIDNIGELSKNVSIGYNRRFYDFMPELKRAVSKGNLLSVGMTLPEVVTPLKESKSDTIKDNILVYMSSHWLDIILYLLGDVEVVSMHRRKGSDGFDISYNGLLVSKNSDIPIHYQSNFDTPSSIDIVFFFSDSVFRLSPFEIMSVYQGIERIEPTKEYPVRRYLPKLVKTYQTNINYKPGFYNQLKYFIEKYLLGIAKENIDCSIEDALRVTMLCEKIKQS